MSMLRRLFATAQPRVARSERRSRAFQPQIEHLEDRSLLSTSGIGSITQNFDRTAIHAGDTLWFSSVFKISGVGAAGATFQFVNDTISYTVKGTNYTVTAPNAAVTLSPTAKQATTTFDASTDTWDTVLPLQFRGRAFLDGAAVPLPSGLPGGVKDVNWQGKFTSTTPGLTVSWQWAAAVYKHFSSDYNALGVEAVRTEHGRGCDAELLRAGTPEAELRYVTEGGTGRGGSDFTGSLSHSQCVTPAQPQAAPATLSGTVYGLNPGDVASLTLTGTTALGQSVTLTVTPDADGNFQFTGLAAGTYTLTLTPPANDFVSSEFIGTVNGVVNGVSTGPMSIGSITLAAGNTGIGYGFSLSQNGGGGGS
jgi:hypothetical protein